MRGDELRIARLATRCSRALMRLLIAALLLLLGSYTLGRVGVSAHRYHSSHPAIAAADYGALLASTAERTHVDTAPAQLLASEAIEHDDRVQSASAPTRDFLSLCSY